MEERDGSIPLSTTLNPIHGRRRIKLSGKVDRRVFYLSMQATFNAIIIGVVAKLLIYLIYFITNVSFYGKFSFEASGPAQNHLGLYVIAIPILGSVIVGIMARFGSAAIRGHGIPEAMEKIILDESKIPPLITILKPISAAISIGTGGPFGAEGPIIATGAAFGSVTGQVIHISPAERKILLSAGACAGMAAIFGCPLAAVLLAVELLLFEFSARSLIPVALGCITGGAMHILLFGWEPVFAMGPVPVATAGALAVYVGMGVVVGVLAAMVSKSVYAIEELFEKLPVHWMWWPAIGAVAVGVVGYFAPHTLGVGYENIEALLRGHLPLTMVFSLCLLKYISWVISLGSGTSGGTLAPLLTIGGALGSLIGLGLLHVFPGIGITVTTACLVGMGAMFAGASRALLTSIVFAFETTGQPNGLLPLLAACIAAYFVSFFLMEGSIMTEKIIRRGVQAPENYEADLLQLHLAGQLMKEVPKGQEALSAVSEDDNLSVCVQIMGKMNATALFVMDKDHMTQVKGIIYARDIMQYYSEQKEADSAYDSPARTRRWMVRARRVVNPHHKV